jgi:hypothetical protein
VVVLAFLPARAGERGERGWPGQPRRGSSRRVRPRRGARLTAPGWPASRPQRRRSAAGDHGRGLIIVDAVSAAWGWKPSNPVKAVYAILTRES